MGGLLSEIAAFVWSVLSHWQAYMTGGIVMAVLFIYERFWSKTVSNRIVIAGIIAFFVAAFFMAWRDLYKANEELSRLIKSNSPDLHANIDMVAVGHDAADPTHNAMITMILSVRNQGTPSIATGWRLLVSMPDKVVEVLPAYIPKDRPIKLLRNEEQGIELSSSDMIYDKTETVPLSTGGMVRGVLSFQLTGYSKEKVMGMLPNFTVKFRDVTGKEITTSYQLLGGGEKHIPGFYLPGINSQPLSTPRPTSTSTVK